MKTNRIEKSNKKLQRSRSRSWKIQNIHFCIKKINKLRHNIKWCDTLLGQTTNVGDIGHDFVSKLHWILHDVVKASSVYDHRNVCVCVRKELDRYCRLISKESISKLWRVSEREEIKIVCQWMSLAQTIILYYKCNPIGTQRVIRPLWGNSEVA